MSQTIDRDAAVAKGRPGDTHRGAKALAVALPFTPKMGKSLASPFPKIIPDLKLFYLGDASD